MSDSFVSLAFFACNFAIILSLIASEDVNSPIVKAPSGSVQGAFGLSRDGRKFHQFLGIPYGKIQSRFADSQPADGWSGIRNATSYGSSCVQLGEGDEDCLFLNVFTPYLPGESPGPLPVLFWIHGGAFFIGNSDLYGPEYYMDEDVVVVTINYRLGVFGFLNLGLDEAPGNQGLKDQVLALRWVNKNIGAFNGDFSKILIFGESAGAASVSLMMLSPAAKGLFHAAISHSGTAICPWVINERAEIQAGLLAQKLSCSGSKIDILHCLQKVDAEEFLNVIPQDMVPKDLGTPEADVLRAMSFIPSLENNRPDSSKSIKYIPQDPLQVMKSSQFADNVPWILGFNSLEGFLFYNGLNLGSSSTGQENIDSFCRNIAPDAFHFKYKKNKSEISNKFFEFYFKNKPNLAEGAINAFSDREFYHCTITAAKLYATKNPVYVFVYKKAGIFSLMSTLLGGDKPPGPTHADDLTVGWKLNSPFLDETATYINTTSSFYNFSKQYIHIAAHFAKTLKAITSWNSKPVKWDPISRKASADFNMLELDDDAKLVPLSPALKNRMQFWDSV